MLKTIARKGCDYIRKDESCWTLDDVSCNSGGQFVVYSAGKSGQGVRRSCTCLRKPNSSLDQEAVAVSEQCLTIWFKEQEMIDPDVVPRTADLLELVPFLLQGQKKLRELLSYKPKYMS